MLMRTIGFVVVLAAIAGGVMVSSPALRAKVSQGYNQVTGWDEAARRADPVGFVTHAETKMRQDLEMMQKTRRELAAEVGNLARKGREQSALAEQAQAMAEEFRTEYQQAKANDSFPIEVRGEAYTESQVRSQLSLLLAEAEGYEQSLADIQSVQSEAEGQMENLAVRISKTESQLASLSAKRELLRARKLTTEGEQLLAQVDELMTGNTQAIAGNPVRTVRELAAAEFRKPTDRATNRRVDDFLAGKTDSKHRPAMIESGSKPEMIPTSYDPRQQELPQSDQDEPTSTKKEKPAKKHKPIFQQSQISARWN